MSNVKKHHLGIFIGLVSLLGAAPLSVRAASVAESVKIWEELGDFAHLKKAEKKKKEPALFGGPREVVGYIVSNEFGEGEVSEFLFTQGPGNCQHVPLPPPERMIHVQMVKGKTTPIFFQKRVLLKGKLSPGERVDSGYEFLAEEVKEFPL